MNRLKSLFRLDPARNLRIHIIEIRGKIDTSM